MVLLNNNKQMNNWGWQTTPYKGNSLREKMTSDIRLTYF